jgi:hypothetical protein
MSANVVQLPKRVERALEPVNLELNPRTIATTLGGSGVLQQGPSERPYERYFRCRCPLCGDGLRIANTASYRDKLSVDCAQGCAPTKVVEELIKLGHLRCKSGWWRP